MKALEKWSWLVFLVVCLVSAIDGADLAVLGAAFKIFEERLSLSPTSLGLMTLAQGFTMAAIAPVWGWLCDKGTMSRRALWTLGACGWATMMLGLSVVSSLWAIIPIRLLNGVFLACLGPLTQSWVATVSTPERSGRLFGLLAGASHLGNSISTLFVISVGDSVVHIAGGRGVGGWRVICFCIAILCYAVAAASWLTLSPRDPGAAGAGHVSMSGMITDIMRNLQKHWKIKTFCIIVFQGVVGAIPWSALSFKLMLFEYAGISKRDINFIVMAEIPPKILGNVLGGVVGDWAARLSPYHGRAWTGMFCVGCGIPLMLAQTLVFPGCGVASAWPYVACSTLFALTACWMRAGVIQPMFLKVVAPDCCASLVAWQVALEGVSAAVLGAPLVGFLMQHAFHYQKTTEHVSDMPEAMRKSNLAALQWAITIMTTVPWVCCFVALTFLHWSYPKDIKDQAHSKKEDVEGAKLGSEDVPNYMSMVANTKTTATL